VNDGSNTVGHDPNVGVPPIDAMIFTVIVSVVLVTLYKRSMSLFELSAGAPLVDTIVTDPAVTFSSSRVFTAVDPPFHTVVVPTYRMMFPDGFVPVVN
jgi:hypothetical protein